MRPTVGRIVHYVNLGDKDGKYPPQVQAAIITAIYEDTNPQDPDTVVLKRVDDGVGTAEMRISNHVDLKIFYTSGFFNCPKIPKRTSPEQRGCWDWLPRV
jgi:hypothetical protein